jgi:hypothetical protein
MFNRLQDFKEQLFGTGHGYIHGNNILDVKKSESKLIDDYETMDKSIQNYHNSYDKHLKNLITLDDFANFNSMETLFKDHIVKKHFKRGDIDKTNPILFRNYLVLGDITPASFRKQHIIQQVRYVLKKYFAPREHQFIKEIDVEVGKNSALISITTIEHNKHKREVKYTKSKSFILKMSEMKTALKNIIGSAKKHLKNDSKIYDISSSNSNSSSESKNSNSENTSEKSTKSIQKSKHKSIHKSTHKKHKHSKKSHSFSDINNYSRRSKRSVAGIKSKFSSRRKSSRSYKGTRTKAISTFMTVSEKQRAKEEEQPVQITTAAQTPGPGYFAAAPATAQFSLQTLNNRKEAILSGAIPTGQQSGPVNCEALEPSQCSDHREECGFNVTERRCYTRRPKPAYGAPAPPPGAFGAPPPGAFGAAPPQTIASPYPMITFNSPKQEGLGDL